MNGQPPRREAVLDEALERIAVTLGVQGECRRSELTQCDGYTVTNRLDVDGEPLDIVDLGYGESRDESP